MAPATLLLLLSACGTAIDAPDSGDTSGTTDSTDTGDSGDTGDSDSGDTQDTAVVADDDVWDDRFVPVYRIQFDTDDWAAELAALIPAESCDDRPWAHATLSYENPRTGETETYEDVGVRYRGHSALSEGQRWGFKVSFDEFVDGREFHELENINLMGTEGDFSLMRERLADWAMRNAGVAAPRVTHAQVYVNDVYQGVFPFSEEADDGAYLDHHFDDGDGNLYKVDGYCGGQADFAYKSDDPQDYVERYEPKAGTDAEAMLGDLFPLIDCAAQDDAGLQTCLPEIVDVDEWLTEVAVDMTLPDVDGLAGAGQNFMLYGDPTVGRLVVYPWDKDQSFSSNAAESTSIWDLHPSWAEGPELVRRMRVLWASDYCAEVLRVAELASPEVLLAEAERIEALLAEPMSRDPYFQTEKDWDDGLHALEVDISERHDLVVAEAEACTPP